MTVKRECSIVVRAYNEEKHIGRLLTGVLQQTLQPVDIILVDSGSTDATIAVASRFPVKIVSIHPNDFTFGRALNRGIEQTQSEFIIIASAHVYPVYPDWLEAMLLPFKDPMVALVYGKQRGNTTTKFSEHQQLAKMFPEETRVIQQLPICNNANAAIRRSLWLERQYDEQLTGLEDLDWASWTIERGFYLSYAAEAEVIHVHDEKPSQVYNRYRREAMGLKRIRPAESFHFWDFMRLYLTNIVSDWWHALRERVFLREFLGILHFRFLQFWGTYRGFAISGPLTSELKQVFYYPRGLRSDRSSRDRPLEPITYPGTDIPGVTSAEEEGEWDGGRS